jgi:hypothetical protein
MEFNMNEPVFGAAIEKDEEDDEEDFEPEKFPLIKATITCTVKAVDLPEGEEIPKQTYVNFKYKGNKQVF